MFRSSKSENISRESASKSPPNIPKLQMELLHEENTEQKEKNQNQYYRLTEDSVSTFIQELLLIMVSSNSGQTPENRLAEHSTHSENLLPNSDRSYERPKRFFLDFDHHSSQNLPPKSPRTIFGHHASSTKPISYQFKVGLQFIFFSNWGKAWLVGKNFV